MRFCFMFFCHWQLLVKSIQEKFKTKVELSGNYLKLYKYSINCVLTKCGTIFRT